jgi:hypothetical protein
VLTFETTGGTPLAPTVTTLAASAMTNTTATIAGMVNPNGQATAYTFEYGPGTGFGAITTVVALDDASTAEPLSAALTGLTPDTRYAYRVVATNATGTSAGAVMTFDTGPGGTPTATTGGATAITATGAALTGSVEAHGLPRRGPCVHDRIGDLTRRLAIASAADEIDALIDPAQVVGVTRDGDPVDEAGENHDRRVHDVGGRGGGAQLARGPSRGGVERVDRHTLR